MPRNSKVLIGHNSNELKQQILGHFTQHNIDSLQNRLQKDDDQRRKELVEENQQLEVDKANFYQYQQMQDQRRINTKMTLKERLIAQKQERLNQALYDRTEEKRPGNTSFVFDPSIRAVPGHKGLFEKKGITPANVTDAFKRLKNPQIEKMKTANIYAKNLGPGIPQGTIDMFRLLKPNPPMQAQETIMDGEIKSGLSQKVGNLVKQREEFH